MKIQVDWFIKSTGKWYAGGLVEIGELKIRDNKFKQAIVDNQNELRDSWTNNANDWFVVTNTTPEQDNDPNLQGFYTHLFKPGSFSGLKKGNIKR